MHLNFNRKRMGLQQEDVPDATGDDADPADIQRFQRLRNEVVRLLINQRIESSGLPEPYQQGRTPLHVAVECGNDTKDTSIISDLLELGAEVDAVDADFNTPLHLAVRKGYRAAVETLLRWGADSNARNSQAYAPLMRAAEKDDVAMAELLVRHGADLDACEPDGMSILHRCGEESRSPALFAYLVSVGADLYRKDKAGYMAIHNAILGGVLCSYILNADANLYRMTDIPRGLLSMILQLNSSRVTNLLKRVLKRLPPEKRKTLINRNPRQFISALCSAAHRNLPECARLLIEHGAEVNMEGSTEGSPLMVACAMGRLGVVKMLVHLGASIAYVKTEVGEDGATATTVRNGLEMAKRFPRVVRWLLVERYMDRPLLADGATSETETDQVGWTGPVRTEVAVLGISDFSSRARNESRMGYLIKMQAVKFGLRGKIVHPLGWFAGLGDGASRWDVP